MRRGFSVVLLTIAAALSTSAFPLAGEHMAGFPVGQHPQWPEGTADLLNCPNRVYGHFFNFADFFCFAGDTQDFNDFIQRYAGLKEVSAKLTLIPGQGKAGAFGSGSIPCDWLVSMSFYLNEGKRVGGATVALWVDGQVQLSEVKLPTNVQLEANADPQAHKGIADFVAAYEERRKAENKTEAAVSSGTSDARPKVPGDLRSKRPLFGKVALTEDGSKVLSVALDESGGTRTGYDLLYADVNFNGRFEESEKSAATAVKRHGTWLASSSFAPIKLNVPYNKKAQGIPDPCEVTLGYRQYPRHGVPEEVSLTAKFKLSQSATEWEYAFSGGVKPSKTLEKAPIWRAEREPKLQMTVRPDGYRKGNLGIGLTLTAGEDTLQCWKAGQPVKAHVEIKKPDGTVAHQGDATLDRFTFG